MTYIEWLEAIRARAVANTVEGRTTLLCFANLAGYADNPDDVDVHRHHLRFRREINMLLERASAVLGRRVALLTTYWASTGKFGVPANWHMRTNKAQISGAARIALLDKMLAVERA